MTADPPQPPTSFIRSRISNACDGCKARKVKCDGKLPCTYCSRRQRPESCHYSPQRQRQRQRLQRDKVRRDGQGQGEKDRERERGGSSPASEGDGVASSSVLLMDMDGDGPRRQSLMTRDDEDHRESETGRGPRTATPGRRSRTGTTTPGTRSQSQSHYTPGPVEAPVQPAPAPARQGLDASAEEETEVPREARLLCDAQGKLIFVGDCAPLSLFQSIRQLVTTRVAHDAFAPQTSRYSVLENAPSSRGHQLRRNGDSSLSHGITGADGGPPEVRPADVHGAVAAYLTATAGMVDLFDNGKLLDDLLLWANLARKPDDAASLVNYLVLAIGRHMDDEDLAQAYFAHARDGALAQLSSDLSVGTVQAFVLVTVYMLCSCQINGAFLFFGIAVRAAYSVGLHRTEVNARFGPDLHRQRDRLWKSLRVVDLFLSTSMGRPPATSDVDCTVSYGSSNDDGDGARGGGRGLDRGGGEVDLLDASVQILLIIEGIVVQIYSRKKISLQLTEGASLQLRDWSLRWLAPLKAALDGGRSEALASGACQVLASYYYAVMLVSRPFLMYELCRRLSSAATADTEGEEAEEVAAVRAGSTTGKSKLADACIDAASLMVDPILDLMERGVLNGRVPMLVSWLFASSLVLGVGLLGGFGRILEKYTRMSIRALDHFARSDAHARQYSLIAQSLLTTALEYLERREMQERMRRTESSSQLFGLVPHEAARTGSPLGRQRSGGGGVSPAPSLSSRGRESFIQGHGYGQHYQHHQHHLTPQQQQQQHLGTPQGLTSPPRLGDIDAAFLGLTESLLQTPDAGPGYWNGNFGGGDADMGSALNLFPLLDAGGGIDLAHYLGSTGHP